MVAFFTRVTTEGKGMGSGLGNWRFDSRSSQERKREWLDWKIIQLINAGHTKKYARVRAKQLYRDLSR